METQSGARTTLVDPFGRELEEWLRDAPATRSPYVADLVVPPVTGPVTRPGTAGATAPEQLAAPTQSDVVPGPVPAAATTPDTAFRRRRDHGRRAASCAPSFPEPPERLALRLEDLAVEVAASSGRTTIERIVLLEDEVRRREDDLARLTAWEATVVGIDDPELEAARGYARTVFADIIADAAAETERQERAAARRAATGAVPVVPAAVAAPLPALVAPESDRELPVRPEPGLQDARPVSASTRPTPLVQPATGPNAVDREAFAAALRAHTDPAAEAPAVFPVEHADFAAADESTTVDAPVRTGWWSRLVAGVLRMLGRR